MKSWAWSGTSFSARDSVPLSDRGFRYGMSVFESLPVRNGAPIFLAAHLARLRAACAQCGFAPDPAALAACGGLLRGGGDGFARIYVTAGDGAVTEPCEDARVFVFLEPREPVPARVYHRGYDLGVSPEPHRPIFGGLKTGNYWSNLEAFRQGVKRSKNETLFFNPDGFLISACMANVFAVFGNEIATPPLAAGARNGVLREWVIERRDVRERGLTRAELEAADEIFLTSSWLGIMPAAALEEKDIASKAISSALRREYEQALFPR